MNNLTISNLSITYANGHRAIHDLTLQLENGIFGLLGPNGAGKSSLINAIVGLQKPNSGRIIFNGIDVLKEPIKLRKTLGFMPQYYGVYPNMSAEELLIHMAKIKGIQRPLYQIQYLLDLVNLTENKNKEVFSFSGGMKQRFGIAQALLGDPKVLIIDEPTSGLDPEERNRLNLVLYRLAKERIILLSTHLVEEVSNLCDRVGILKSGKLVASGSPDELIKEVNGKIWRSNSLSDTMDYSNSFKLLSRRLIHRKIQTTVFADDRPQNFDAISAQLEHVYFKNLL